jgi:hypothetical protein
LQPGGSGVIRDYIVANRDTYTREAIIEQLVAAGHDKVAVERTWEELSTGAPMGGQVGTNMAPFAWFIFGLGAAVLLAGPVLGTFSGGSTFAGELILGVGWLGAYLAVGVWPTLWFARQRPRTALGVVALAVAVPIAMVLVGGGICLGTLFVVFQAMSS